MTQTEKWGDRYVSEDVGLVAEQIAGLTEEVRGLRLILEDWADLWAKVNGVGTQWAEQHYGEAPA